ncbi:hypothetical protein Cob_v002819 [Colletotrichum orbiculare MAFF 240422]|uniref:Uncharacterized protein n=1 Tax=Colletotrichum orbiculare (strain 104-T / ATCC 96160 / CBS 514.97 / LARS 414 / MAFF 240422) TaxID=1213857 RepID=N4UR99_COLOR|nr:hypothetical protein Cob_v002819 [Colletotrichum orbiculare MAFF 240422]
MDLKQIQLVQSTQGERLARVERRQEQDASLKSVWQQHPFPGVLAGTPQQGPTQMSPSDMFDDFDEQGQHLLNSLHLSPAEEEPIRRGAASRANSVRFDESALRGADWTSQSNRHSGDFGPPRPSSGLMMERSLSHKSDGRHSSAGHSVHSFHSVASGRASSLGLDTNFMVSSHEDDSPLDMPEPPPGLFILGSVPTIIRCWLSTHFAHNTILYADLCTGSQRSVVDYSVIRDLDLVDEIQRDMDGTYKVRLPVYLVEATVSERSSRSSSPGHQIPSITTTFEVLGMDSADGAEPRKGIQVFIGSDTLRAHQADILLSQNRMCLYGSEREKLSVPFVRPEDEAIYKHISTSNAIPEKPRLNANAAPFVSGEPHSRAASTHGTMENSVSSVRPEDGESQEPNSPVESQSVPNKSIGASNLSESGGESERPGRETMSGSESGAREVSGVQNSSASTEGNRRESAGGIWGSWRQGTTTNGAESGARDANGPLSGYQPAGRGGRNMKVLKPLKPGSSSSARTGAAYEPAPAPRASGEHRRKSQANVAAESAPTTGTIRWEPKRAVSATAESKTTQTQREAKNAAPPLPRSANPIGGASAFSWMNPASKAKPTATAE